MRLLAASVRHACPCPAGTLFTPGASSGSPMRPGCMDAADAEVFKAAAQRPGALRSMLNYYRALLLWDMAVPGYEWPEQVGGWVAIEAFRPMQLGLGAQI